jgi:hypothetical protein
MNLAARFIASSAAPCVPAGAGGGLPCKAWARSAASAASVVVNTLSSPPPQAVSATGAMLDITNILRFMGVSWL